MYTAGLERFEHHATYIDLRHGHTDLVPPKGPQSGCSGRKHSARRAHISLISYLEVIYGCRSAEELRELRLVCSEAFEEILPLAEEVSELAARFMERYVLAKRPQGEDMLIAATALSRGEGLATANLKHFDFVPGLKLKPFRP